MNYVKRVNLALVNPGNLDLTPRLLQVQVHQNKIRMILGVSWSYDAEVGNEMYCILTF